MEYDNKTNLLRDWTQKERRNLLASSAFGLVVVKVGLVPTKIAALGLEFSSVDRRTLLWCIWAIVLYFLTAFLIYATDDFIDAKFAGIARMQKAQLDGLENPQAALLYTRTQKQLEQLPAVRIWNGISRFNGLVRNPFDFVLPAVVGLYALWAVFPR
jgi:hypothetical protein